MVEDRASCGNYSPRFGSWFANTDLEEDGELAPRRHRDVAVAVLHVSRGHPSLWYWMIWFTKCTDISLSLYLLSALGSQFYRHSYTDKPIQAWS